MERRILNIVVDAKKNEIIWESYSRNDDGSKFIHGPKYQDAPVQFETGDLSQKTIDLLIRLQKYLTGQERKTGARAEEITTLANDLTNTLGDHLYNFLFPEEKPHTRVINDELKCIDNRTLDLLRVELEFIEEKEQLASLPWEYLRHPTRNGTGRFLLGDNTQLVLIRTLYHRSIDPQVLGVPPPVRVLLIVAQPKEDNKYKLGGVAYELVHELLNASSEMIKLDTLIDSDFTYSQGGKPNPKIPSWKNFSERIMESKNDDNPYQIIHFIGHGRRVMKGEKSKSELAFVDLNGEVDWVPDEIFADKVGQLIPDIKLVFLQACEGALLDPLNRASGAALQLAYKNIPAVVAMQAEVENRVANEFACGFYQALTAGHPIDIAVKSGRNAITEIRNEMRKLDFGIPVLYLHSYDSLIDREKKKKSEKRLTRTGSNKVNSSTDREEPNMNMNRACKRCETPINRETQQYCTTCELKLKCECGQVYDDPLGNVCGECGRKIPPQPPWLPETSRDPEKSKMLPDADKPPNADDMRKIPGINF